jgi:VWFA-related protein
MKGLLSVVTVVLLASIASHAQQPANPPSSQQPATTFRADINVVEVHAVVTDERGAFVNDLTREDFEIYEDGRLQETRAFALVDLPVEPPLKVAGAASDVESDVVTTTRSFDGRIYVFVLDDLHTTTLRTHLVRDAARAFVDRHFGTNDRAAVIFTSGRQDAAQELTNSRRLLRAAIEKFQGQKLPSATAERLGVYMTQRDMERAASDESSSGSTRDPRGGRVDDPYDAERGMNARRALETVRNVAEWMTDIPGRRKALVLFSEGIDYDIHDVFNNQAASMVMDEARRSIAAAQRANVSIYAVDPRGLTQLGDEQIAIQSLPDDPQVDYGTARGFQNELLLAQESLMSLAEETGGTAVVRTNDIAGGLERIVRENSQYYILGYETDITRGPGKFRRIEVRVKRPGLQVRARRGYVPPDPKAIARKEEKQAKAGTTPALAAALNNPLPIGELPVRVFAAPLRSSANTRNTSVLLAVEIDGKALKYEQKDGRYTEKVELSVIAADYGGKVRGSDRQTLDLKLRPETYEMLQHRGGVRLLSRVDVPPARYQLRVGVHESVGGAISTVPYDIEAPDYNKVKFALGGPVIASTGAAAYVTAKPDEQWSTIFPAPPVATRTFARDEVLGVYTELYDNVSTAAHKVDFELTIRTAADGREVFASRETRDVEAGRNVRTLGYKTEVPLRDYAPGTYVLRVQATSPIDQQSTAREIPFEIVEGAPTTF